MTKYEDLQAQHQALLNQRQTDRDIPALVEAVKAYVKRVRDESEVVPSPRDRDQLRANLRFWSTFLYDHTGVYPDTTLRPPLPSVLEVGSTGDVAPPSAPVLEAGSARPMAQMQAPKKGLPISRIAILGIGAFAILLIVLIGGLILSRSLRNRSLSGFSPTKMPASMSGTEVAAMPTETLSPSTGASQIPQPAEATELVGINTTVVEHVVTVTPYIDQGAVATATPTMVSFPATATEALLIPVTGGGGGGEFVPDYLRPVLSARVSVSTNPSACEVGVIQVAFNLGPNESVTQTVPVSERELGINVRQIGGALNAPAPRLRRDQNNFVFPLGDTVGVPTYLVHIEHPLLTADDVIVQIGRDCINNLVKVTYSWSQGSSFVDIEPPRNPSLALEWELVNWGPVPRLDPANPETAWVAMLNLTTGNHSGDVVYFKYSSYEGFQPLAGNQVLLEGYDPCEPAVMLVGAASEGQSIAREIRLVSPYCVEAIPLPEAPTNIEPSSTITPTPSG